MICAHGIEKQHTVSTHFESQVTLTKENKSYIHVYTFVCTESIEPFSFSMSLDPIHTMEYHMAATLSTLWYFLTNQMSEIPGHVLLPTPSFLPQLNF